MNSFSFSGSEAAAQRLRDAYNAPTVEQTLGVPRHVAEAVLEWPHAFQRVAIALEDAGGFVRRTTQGFEEAGEQLTMVERRFEADGGTPEIRTLVNRLDQIQGRFGEIGRIQQEWEYSRSRVDPYEAQRLRTAVQGVAEELGDLARRLSTIEENVARRAQVTAQSIEELVGASRRVGAIEEELSAARPALQHLVATGTAIEHDNSAAPPTEFTELMRRAVEGALAAAEVVQKLEVPDRLREPDVSLMPERNLMQDIKSNVDVAARIANNANEMLYRLPYEVETTGAVPRWVFDPLQDLQRLHRQLGTVIDDGYTVLRIMDQNGNELAMFNRRLADTTTQLRDVRSGVEGLTERIESDRRATLEMVGLVDQAFQVEAASTREVSSAEAAIRPEVERRIAEQDGTISSVIASRERFEALDVGAREAVVDALVARHGFGLVYGDAGLEAVRAGRSVSNPSAARHLEAVESAFAKAEKAAPEVLVPITPTLGGERDGGRPFG